MSVRLAPDQEPLSASVVALLCRAASFVEYEPEPKPQPLMACDRCWRCFPVEQLTLVPMPSGVPARVCVGCCLSKKEGL